jgi:hypothetical protein
MSQNPSLACELRRIIGTNAIPLLLLDEGTHLSSRTIVIYTGEQKSLILPKNTRIILV